MRDSSVAQLTDETSAWCSRADELTRCVPDDVFACLAVVREGILLRRRWDRLDRDAPARRRLLALLAAAENVCHCRLAAAADDRAAPESAWVEHLIRRLAEDDRYLAGLLDDSTLPAETVAFAVECFRDDLHWLGTLAALLDGAGGIDFAGRILLEQESLQRSMQSWGEGNASADEEIREAARRLRRTALARQAESLLERPDPNDLAGWYRAWQAAGRLMMRPKGAAAAELERAVADFRDRARRRWERCLAELPLPKRHDALRRMAEDLADAAGEAMTFLEDLPLDQAVRSLEILAEDAATCMEVLKEHGGSKLAKLRHRLRRRQKVVAAELQERRLGSRMERLFGHKAVAALERLVLLLLLLFVVMLAVEGPLTRYEAQYSGGRVVEAACAWLDLGICVVFLAEFSLKISLATPRGLYLRRNWITGLLPAIPVGFLIFITSGRGDVAVAGEGFVLLRSLRYLRLPQMTRWLRIARPIVRFARLAAFVMQASDRLVRQVAPLVNRNLVSFQRAAIELQQPQYRVELAALRERFYYRASEVITEVPHSARRPLIRCRIDDLTAMLSAPRCGLAAPAGPSHVSTAREIRLEQVIARLLAATPAGISQRIGRTLAQSVARWCRAFDVFGVRRLPVISSLVEAGRRPSPYEATAQVANRIGVLLKQTLDRVYWMADLYGTVTAPQLVDSLGEWMVKSASRPARRFLLIGFAFLAASQLAYLMYVPEAVTRSLERLVGTPLVVLGLLCLIPLLVGLWFRQIAGEATDFCNQVAEAQFITATKRLKRRVADRHRTLLHSRVIAPEVELGLCREEARSDGHVDPTRTAVELLFDDYLDAAPFHQSDTRTTTQLLGNLTLVSLRESRLCYGRRQQKRLRRLDLAGTRSWLRGPYLWFRFISRSLAQQTAKLVVDYNAHALTLDRAASADEDQIRRYVEWLARRSHTPIEQLELPAEFRRRLDPPSGGTDDPAAGKRNGRGREFQGNEFTAVHFLSADPDLEADVRRRYGKELAELMRRDRRDNIRRVFRTYPLHRWPKEQRTFNALSLHTRYLAGGRVLLLPLRLLRVSVRLTLLAAAQLWRFVRDVLYPTVDDLDPLAEPDPFAVAVRKIHRMRKPVFLECLRMRAAFDPEYLGVLMPGPKSQVARVTAAPIEEDLALIDADPGVRQRFRRLAAEHRRRVRDFRRLVSSSDGGPFSAESLRAMAIAYAIDFRGVRSRFEAAERLKMAFDEVDPKGPAMSRSLRQLWCRWRYARDVRRLFERPDFVNYSARRRNACAAAIYGRRGALLGALRTLTRGDGSVDPIEDARQIVAAVGRDPATWTRQLVVLRAVQTLSVLDLTIYCDLVAELGEYGPDAVGGK